MREVIPYRDLPREVAIAAYRWLLVLATEKAKGKVKKIVTAYDKANRTEYSKIWEKVANTIRSDPYYYRLRKAVAAYKIKECPWCTYYKNNKCRAAKCKFNFSQIKDSKVFEVDLEELRFVMSFLDKNDIDYLEEMIYKVDNLYTYAEEQFNHEKIFIAVLQDLTKKGHFDKKANSAGRTLYLYGVMPDDIKQILYTKVWNLVLRYDYLPFNELLLKVARALTNEVTNEIRNTNIYERYMDYGKNAVPPIVNEDNEQPDIYAWDEIANESNPETEYLDAKQEELYKKFNEYRKCLSVIEDMYCSVMLGEENEAFITYLKQIKKIKRSNSWETFYNNASIEDMKNSLNTFFGYDVAEEIKEKIEPSNQGGSKMAEKVKIDVNVPKKTCLLCKYWVEWWPKKRIPKDCNPSYPGCPVHVYNVEHKFPIRDAALQFRKFVEMGEDELAQEFINKAPNSTAIVKAAMKLTDEEVIAALEEDAKAQASEEEEVDIESMNRVEMLNLIIKCQLPIPGIDKMDDEELRETLTELYETHVLNKDDDPDDDEDERIGAIQDDDEDDDVKAIQVIEPLKNFSKRN